MIFEDPGPDVLYRRIIIGNSGELRLRTKNTTTPTTTNRSSKTIIAQTHALKESQTLSPRIISFSSSR